MVFQMCQATTRNKWLFMVTFIFRLKGKGLDLNKGDYDNRTPLHLAASQGRVEVIEFLLAEAKVEIDRPDR